LDPGADGVLNLYQLTCKEVIGVLDPDHFRRGLRSRDHGGDLIARAELVAGPADEELGHGAAGEEIIAIVAAFGADRQAEGDGAFDTAVGTSGAEADVGAEREPSEQKGEMEVAAEPIKCGADVVLLATAVIVAAFAEAGSTEVETEDWEAEGVEGLHGVVDDLVVHRASAEGVRMAEEDGVLCVRRAGVEESLQASSGAGEVFNGADGGGSGVHSIYRKT
jgi:hypothetical protein